MSYTIRSFGAALVVAVGVTGCPAEDESSSGSATEATGAGDDDGASTMAADDGMSASNTGTPPADSDDTMGADDAATMMMDDGPATVGDDDGPTPQPNGGMCAEDAECESMQCFDGGFLGGICGECNEDADCPEGGCSVPNPLNGTPSVCNMGEMGGGCQSDKVCDEGLICAEILNVPMVIMASTCSECNTDADCTDQLCAPTYDVANVSGYKSCVDPMSLENGSGCDLVQASGDMSCVSGICAPADVMGFLELGVCSDCEVDEDCGMNEVCMPATVDLAMGLVAAFCEPA